jgi:phage terminase small subunit
MGVAPKPIELHLINGNKSGLSKEEIEMRREAEIRLGNDDLVAPDWVRSDVIALEKWNECVGLYRGHEFVSSSDVGNIARYCRTYSEYRGLIEHRAAVADIAPFSERDQGDISNGLKKHGMDGRGAAKVFEKVSYLLTVSGMLFIDAAINKKMEQLLKMEDRLFLNPLAKIRNVPKKKKKSEEKIERLFGAV